VQKILYILFFFVCSNAIGQTQTVTQYFTDRCTNEVKTVTANFVNGSAVVSFYSRVKTFTWEEYTNGTLQAWLNETYAWWANLSPCSANTASQQSAQQTSTSATTNATNAASNATSNTSTTSNTNTGSTNTSSSSTTSGSSSSGNDSSNNSGSSSTGNDNSGGDNSGGDNSGDSGSSNDNSSETDNSSDDTSSSDGDESSSEQEETESSNENEESNEEQEEQQEEESKEDEESDSEDDSDDGEESEEENNKKRNPIAVSANLLTQSALDGTITNAASLGFSQSSLTGTTTYSANVMVWDNLKQFTLSLSESNVFFNYDREEKLYLRNPDTGKKDLYFGSTYGRGSIMMIQSVTAGFMYIYKTKVASFGLSNVYLGQKDNFWKGFVGGFALSGTIINIDDTLMIMPSSVLFGTKPFPTKKVIISPMLALAFNPISYSFDMKKDILKGDLILNEHVTYIVGSNFDVSLTQRFRFNIGGNIIGTTLPGIPLTWSGTIGSKFQF